MPNGTYGGVRGEKFIKNHPLLNRLFEAHLIFSAFYLNVKRKSMQTGFIGNLSKT